MRQLVRKRGRGIVRKLVYLKNVGESRSDYKQEDRGGKPVVHNVRFVTGVEKDLEIVQSWWEQRERQKKENFLGKKLEQKRENA